MSASFRLVNNNVMKKKVKAVTPFFGVTTLDFFYAKVAEAFGFENTSPEPNKKRVNKLEWAVAFIVLISQMILAAYRLRSLHDVQYKNIKFGCIIRESTICLSTHARFKLGITLLDVTLAAAKIFCFWKSEFRRDSVGLVIGGTESYIYFGVISQLAKQYSVPVISIRQYEKHVVVNPFDLGTLRGFPATYDDWPDMASDLDLGEAYKVLEERIDGNYRSISYMARNSVDDLQTPDSENLQNAIWIYAHDFFDSPSVWGEGIFYDQVEWLEKSINCLLNNGAKVIVKWHPNAREKCGRIYAQFEKKFSARCRFLSDRISLNKVHKFSPLGIVTSMGSVIPEAAFMGIPIVAASPHPYMCVGLAPPPTSVSQYEQKLQSLITATTQASPTEMSQKAVMATALMHSVLIKPAQSAEFSFGYISQTLRKIIDSREEANKQRYIPTKDTLIECLDIELNSNFGSREFNLLCERISELTGLDYRRPPINDKF